MAGRQTGLVLILLDMRVFLKERYRNDYFKILNKESGLTWQEIAFKLKVHPRTFRDYRSGKATTPLKLCNKIEKLYGISLPNNFKKLNSYWYTRIAGRKGAYARNKLYGNPGTAAGRHKGGLNSLKSEKMKKTAFKFRKKIIIPNLSTELAELVGILMGDGGITTYQVRVTLDANTDQFYSKYVKSLFEKLFNVNASLFLHKSHSTLEVAVNGRSLVELLIKLGLPLGNKIKNNINIPEWIRKNNNYCLLCLRGLFDTDGCIYIDKHIYKNSNYRSINIDFKSASNELLKSIFIILKSLGMHPLLSSPRSVRLRRRYEIDKFFEIIGSSNHKNIVKYREFTQLVRYPSGRTEAVSKTVEAH